MLKQAWHCVRSGVGSLSPGARRRLLRGRGWSFPSGAWFREARVAAVPYVRATVPAWAACL